MKDLLVLSNGHGEDTIACSVLAALAPGLAAPDVWPMVGSGAAYRQRGLVPMGPPNLLPSEGFGTLDGRLFLRDLAAGWIGTYLRQMRAARRLRGQYRMILGVGDIVPILAAWQARTPFVFLGCAKSSYYRSASRYTALERHLLRRHARLSFPRDQRTADELRAAGVAAEYLGNPMMDGLEGTGDTLGLASQDRVIVMLPGSRADAADNLTDLLAIAVACTGVMPQPSALRFVFPLASGIGMERLRRQFADGAVPGWTLAAEDPPAATPRLWLDGPGGARALLVEGRFADALRRADLAFGMAGTANEQAVGLGVPLVALPGRGAQGVRFARMKAGYFGPAARLAPREPVQAAQIAAAVLADPQEQARMRAAGHERMGLPGASAAIAGRILQMLEAERARQ